MVVCCGSGGVGKTTTAAALALRAAERGRRTVVLTIDPARRLAQSLGLRELGNHPRQVQVDGFEPEGELYAMMLDMRRTFDDMVRVHAGPDRAEQILANPFYQTISTSFSGTQEYMAMEKLGQLAATGDWDLIVVDTPPSRSALDFLDAPQRLSTVLDGRIIRLLSGPARAGGRGLRKLVGAGFGLFAKAVSTIIGGQLLADASAFVQAFDSMFGGFRERARKTAELLRSPGTAFLVVAAPEPDALREASYFVERLAAESMPLAGLVPTGPTRCWRSCPAREALAAAEPAGRRRTRRWPRPCCGCTPTGWPWRPARSGCWRGSPRPTPRWRWSGCRRWPATCTTSTGCAKSAPSWPVSGSAGVERHAAAVSAPRTQPTSTRSYASRLAASSRSAQLDHVGPAAQQGPPLALGHAAPDAELDAVVERLGQALRADRAAQADGFGSALLGTPDEQAVRIVVAAGRADPPARLVGFHTPSSLPW